MTLRSDRAVEPDGWAGAGADRAPTLLATFTGADRPGVTSAVFAALAGRGLEVLDVAQLVVRGHLTLALLTTVDTVDAESAAGALRRVAAEQRLVVDVTTSAEHERPPGRAGSPGTGERVHVTVLGAPLRPEAVAEVAGRVAAGGANIDAVRRLASRPVTALELDVSGADPAALRADLAARAAGLGIDVAVSPAGLARHGRRLVVLDVDSTLIQDEVIELLAAHAGRAEEVAAVTERAMRGELDFAASLHERVAALAGLDAGVVDDVRAAVRLTPGADVLCAVLHSLGFTLALVSGGFSEVVEPLAASLGITRVRANRLEVVDGRLTGRVLGPVVDRAGKAAALREFAAAEGLPLSRTVAVGDGANDLDMLAAAGLGVAFNAKPLVAAAADTALTSPYLDSVLHLLGLSREEIEEAGRVRPDAPWPVDWRPLTREDLPLLGRWLRDPRVARWWADDPSPRTLEAHYGPGIDGTDPTQVLVVSTGGRPFGIVQRYRVADEPEHLAELAALLPVPPGALSIDYLIGEADLQGRGLGPAAISAVVADAWRAYPDAGDVLVPVAAGNRASWRALEKAGFSRAAEGEMVPDDPADPRDHVVYRLSRPSGGRGRLEP